jgi:Golgi apparatus protein 1
MKQRSKLSPDCEYELFRQEVETAGDIRLSVRLFRACLPDKKQFCADVAPGQALASQCLEEHKDSLSEACRCVQQLQCCCCGSNAIRVTVCSLQLAVCA